MCYPRKPLQPTPMAMPESEGLVKAESEIGQTPGPTESMAKEKKSKKRSAARALPSSTRQSSTMLAGGPEYAGKKTLLGA